MIGGEEYTVRSDLPPEYTREVAAYVDQALKKVLSQGPIVETHKAAILAALDITNRSEEHTSELQSHSDLVCRLLLEKKKKIKRAANRHSVHRHQNRTRSSRPCTTCS